MADMRRRLFLFAALLVVGLLVAVAVPVGVRLGERGDRVVLSANTPYTQGSYYGYVSPWGAERSPIFRRWVKLSESMWVDVARFPAGTRFNWAWPPFSAPNNVGVWGYHHLGYGNYDGGDPEKAIPPRRLRDVKSFRTAFAWDGDFRFGQSTVLAEFYLRSDPRNNESKRLEVGWMLHMSPATKSFVARSEQLGIYVDPAGRRWRVAKAERFVTFSPADGSELNQGVLDMRHALGWLKAKGLARDEDWLNGVAIGAEPIKGFGHVEIRHWQVDLR